MASWQNELITRGLLPLLDARERAKTPAQVRERLRRRAVRPASHAPPRGLDRKAQLNVAYRGAWPIYEATPWIGRPKARVLYLHGGAYIYEIGRVHWRLVGQLVREAKAHVTVPIYPPAPRGTAKAVVSTVADIAAALVEREEHVVLLGDSAGGGMALAAAMELRDRGVQQPARIALISPWLDVTTASSVLFAEAGRIYGGSLDPHDSRVSPLFGELTGLAPITVFSGSRDPLHGDSLRLAAHAREQGCELALHEGVDLPHVFPLMPTPEGARARAELFLLLDPGDHLP